MKITKDTKYTINFEGISQREYLVLIRSIMNTGIKSEILDFAGKEWSDNILDNEELSNEYENLTKK